MTAPARRPRRFRRLGRLLAALALSAAAASPARAALCVVQTQAVGFGAYDVFVPVPTDTVGAVVITCLAGVNESVHYTVRLSPGSSGSAAARVMRSADGWGLAYNLYSDAARSLVWGDGSGGTQVLRDGFAVPNVLVQRRYPIYGRLPARQNVPPGMYVDTLVVSVDY